MKFYLAARYSRRQELVGYKANLEELGLQVRASWLDGNHQITDQGVPVNDQGEPLADGSPEIVADRNDKLRAKWALEDIADVAGSDYFVAFTEEPRSGHSRGGRHVELGYAYGVGKTIIVVGPRENIFCWLPAVYHFPTWNDFIGMLRLTHWAHRHHRIAHMILRDLVKRGPSD